MCVNMTEYTDTLVITNRTSTALSFYINNIYIYFFCSSEITSIALKVVLLWHGWPSAFTAVHLEAHITEVLEGEK